MHNNATFSAGLKHGVPIALGYLVISFTFGMIACGYGLSIGKTTLTSLTNLTSAGQFAGINLIFGHGSYIELLLSMIIINSRYALMATAISQKLEPNLVTWKKALMATCVTDETFATAMIEVDTIKFRYWIGLITLPYICWSLGTFLGGTFDSLLNSQMKNAASIALYCMFIALFIPDSRNEKSVREVVIITILISVSLYFAPIFSGINDGYKILISAIAGATYGAIRYPKEIV